MLAAWAVSSAEPVAAVPRVPPVSVPLRAAVGLAAAARRAHYCSNGFGYKGYYFPYGCTLSLFAGFETPPYNWQCKANLSLLALEMRDCQNRSAAWKPRPTTALQIVYLFTIHYYLLLISIITTAPAVPLVWVIETDTLASPSNSAASPFAVRTGAPSGSRNTSISK